jgi:LacI family transcriptional regulator
MKNTSVTIADIAAKLDVNRATVSRALKNDPRISEATRKRVEKTAKLLNYRRNNLASALRSGKSKLIGVLIPSAEINFFGSVVHGMETVAAAKGYNVLLFQSNEDPEFEKKGLEAFVHARVEGVLVSIAKNTRDYTHFEELNRSGTPLVFFDRAVEKLGAPFVVANDFQGGYDATTHLITQGFKRIAHITGPQHLEIFSNRLKGYKKALKDHNIPFDPELICKGDVSIEAGRKGMAYFWSLKKKPDALFAVEDFTALGALKALKELKVKVPQDFGVVGFANEGFGEHVSPSLSSVDQQTVLMGKKAMELLLEMTTNHSIAVKEKQKIVIDPVLVFRESSVRKK